MFLLSFDDLHKHIKLLNFNPNSGVRPFGVSLLICGWDEDRPFLFQCDPSVCNNVTIS